MRIAHTLLALFLVVAATVRAGATEPVDQFVTHLYRTFLEREPDTAGLAAWSTALANGEINGIVAARGFIQSREFQGRGLGHEAFLRALYRGLLDREADNAGLEGHLQELIAGLLREDAADRFLHSEEFRLLCLRYGIAHADDHELRRLFIRRFVRRLYRLCFEREPDEGGIAGWLAALRDQEIAGNETALAFLGGGELAARQLSDEAFVDTVYRALFDRAPDDAGHAAWVAALRAGVTRSELIAAFAHSEEFRRLCLAYRILWRAHHHRPHMRRGAPALALVRRVVDAAITYARRHLAHGDGNVSQAMVANDIAATDADPAGFEAHNDWQAVVDFDQILDPAGNDLFPNLSGSVTVTATGSLVVSEPLPVAAVGTYDVAVAFDHGPVVYIEPNGSATAAIAAGSLATIALELDLEHFGPRNNSAIATATSSIPSDQAITVEITEADGNQRSLTVSGHRRVVDTAIEADGENGHTLSLSHVVAGDGVVPGDDRAFTDWTFTNGHHTAVWNRHAEAHQTWNLSTWPPVAGEGRWVDHVYLTFDGGTTFGPFTPRQLWQLYQAHLERNQP